MAVHSTSPAFTYDQQPHYDYKPLADPSKSFRLFHLQPLQTDGVIRGTTHQHAIDKAPQYIALSYEWGPAQDFHWIEVDGCRLQVRDNLFNVLIECVRRENVDLPFFADAVCVDQSNNAERNAQVRLMSTIYRQSSLVSAWLNVNVPYVKSLFNFLAYHRENAGLPLLKYTKLKSDTVSPTLIHGPDDHVLREPLHPMFTRTQFLPTGEEICLGHEMEYGIRINKRVEFRCLYCALMPLLSATYWSRVWIVPECILGRKMSINCMGSAITSSTLTHAVDVFTAFKQGSRHLNWGPHGPGGPRDSCPAGLKVLGMRQKWRKGVEVDRAIDILTLIGGLRQHYCANDRDRIYSLLGLDHYFADLPLDYKNSRLHVFLEVLFFLDRRQKGTIPPPGSLDRLCVSWRTLSSCYSLTRALKLDLPVHTSDLKGDVTQFETDRQGKLFCIMGCLLGIESVITPCACSDCSNSIDPTCSTRDGSSDFSLDRGADESKRIWHTNVPVRTDDRFVDVGGDPDLGLGVVFRFNGLDWQFLAIARPSADSRIHDSYEEIQEVLLSDLTLQRVLTQGKVRLVGHTLVYDLGLSDAIELHLLLGPTWLKYNRTHQFVSALAENYHTWYGPEFKLDQYSQA